MPDDVFKRLREKAELAGLDVEKYAARLIESEAMRPTLLELSRDLYDQFVASGMTDDQLGQLLEDAKHEMRRDRVRRVAS